MTNKLLSIKASFFPIRLIAYTQNDVEIEVTIQNNTEDIYWTECDVELPEAISLSKDKKLIKGRSRVGIVGPDASVTKRIKIYGRESSYPDLYTIKLTAYGFDQEGKIQTHSNKSVKLRCEKLDH
ncbi:hypothetical protein KO317_01505 [Candidatus Micrarchaeota archaeon]|nr:hypothetical protein [Candidatus Micrarchaeota archaeon]